MRRSVYWQGKGHVDLSDRDYLASGGEADVYRRDDWALKLYHDKDHILPAGKMRELGQIGAANVLLPEALLFDPKDRSQLGFAMRFVAGAEPLVKYFAPAYRQRKGLHDMAVGRLIEAMRQTVTAIHRANCLVVDFNEMNVLLAAGKSYFIDTDSYQTPSYPASAISPAIRDPQAHSFSQASDWFSFAIIIFQLYAGIHPYKGSHPDYAVGDLQGRMAGGVSVFHPMVKLPPACRGFGHIPPDWLVWFKALFEQRERRPPPSGDREIHISAPLRAPAAAGTEAVKVTETWSSPEPILAVFPLFSGIGVVTASSVWLDGQPITRGVNGRKTLLTETEDGLPILASIDKEEVLFQTEDGVQVGRTTATGWFSREGMIYTLDGHNLVSHHFTRLGGNVVRKARIEATVQDRGVLLFDGVLVKPMLGRTWLWWPQRPGVVHSMAVPELDGFRLLHARARGHVCMLVGERKGRYYRFVLFLADTGRTYSAYKEIIEYGEPNFVVLDNGICAHIPADGELTLFHTIENRATFVNATLSMSMPLFTAGGQVYLCDGSRICQLTTS